MNKKYGQFGKKIIKRAFIIHRLAASCLQCKAFKWQCHLSSGNLILRSSCPTLCTWMASPSCSFTWLAIEKLLSHFKDLKGFNSCVSPLMLLKELDLEKHLSHFVHLNGFSPVWSPVSPRNFMLRADWRPRHFEWLPLYSKKLFYRITCPQSRVRLTVSQQ